MKEKYKYMFMRYIYKKIGLEEIENNFSVAKIKDLGVGTKNISKYFRIVNDVNENALSDTLKKRYDYYFSHSIEELSSPKLEEELSNFFEETYKILLFPNVDEAYIYYGNINYNYMAPRDSIVLGFYYNEFEIEEEDFDKKRFENDSIICNNLNFIQSVLAPRAGMKVSVIKYNEFAVNNNIKR